MASLSEEAAETVRQRRARAAGPHTSGHRQPVIERRSDIERQSDSERWNNRETAVTERWQSCRDGSHTETEGTG